MSDAKSNGISVSVTSLNSIASCHSWVGSTFFSRFLSGLQLPLMSPTGGPVSELDSSSSQAYSSAIIWGCRSADKRGWWVSR